MLIVILYNITEREIGKNDWRGGDRTEMLSYQLKSASLSCYFVMCGSVYSRDLCRVTSYSEEYYLP